MASRAAGSASNWPSCFDQRFLRLGLARAARAVERLIDVGEIEHMRAVDDRGAELDRLDRILPAVLDQRAAHEHDRRKAIEQAELAERVGDIDVGHGRRQFARANAAPRFSPRRCDQSARSPGPRSGWRGTITVRSDGKNPARVLCASIRISSSPGWVEAATMIGRPRVSDISRSSLSGSAGGAGTSSLRLPVVTTLRQPSAAKRSASVCDCARQMSNLSEQRRDRAVHAAPARERTLRHPPVDQDHRQPPRRARQDQVRPQIGFDEQRQRRPPVIEEARRHSAANRRAHIDG